MSSYENMSDRELDAVVAEKVSKDHDGGVFTQRGFQDYCELVDRYGSTVTVRQSSLASEPCVWIFSKKDGQDGVFHLGKWQAYSPHLTVEQAKRVRDALQRFIDDNTKGG